MYLDNDHSTREVSTVHSSTRHMPELIFIDCGYVRLQFESKETRTE
jgi:hypothetical protein